DRHLAPLLSDQGDPGVALDDAGGAHPLHPALLRAGRRLRTGRVHRPVAAGRRSAVGGPGEKALTPAIGTPAADQSASAAARLEIATPRRACRTGWRSQPLVQ